MKTPDLVTVMPVYNEEANISAVITTWLDAFAREGVAALFIAVNDGSRDASPSILKQLQQAFPEQLVVIDKTNSGHGRSCRIGYEAAVERRAPWILQIDSDGQCDPDFFPAFWAKRHQADCVFGWRVVRDDSARKLISSACRLLIALMTGRDLKDPNVPYRLMKLEAVQKALPSVPKDFDLQNIALTFALKRNSELRWEFVPIRFRTRQGGTHSLNFPKIVKMGFKMLLQIRTIGKSECEHSA